MRSVTLYEAFDGARFDSAESCRAHEAAHVETRLVGLTIEQVRAAMSREDTDLADAIEELGKRLTNSRRAAGDLRRGKPAAEAAEGQAEVDGKATAPVAAKLDQVLQRARTSGLAAAKDALVPDLFANVPELREAWLAGQAEAARAKAA